MDLLDLMVIEALAAWEQVITTALQKNMIDDLLSLLNDFILKNDNK